MPSLNGSQINLAATSATYMNRLTVVGTGTDQWVPLLPPDPRRWYLRLEVIQSGATGWVFSPIITDLTALLPNLIPARYELKYRDAPSLVTGPWFMFAAGGGLVLCSEELYIR